MKILLTGVSGFIGSHMLQHILEKTDWQVIGVASWKHKGTPERVEQVLSKNPAWKDRLTIITHDLVSPFTEMTKARIGTVDYIINVASESHVDRSITDPVPFVKNNIDLMLSVLEFAREVKPSKFVQISTDEVYGVAPEGVNHKEWSPIVPSNPYSASKSAQEALCISYWRTYGLPLIITNTMNNFGEMQDPEKFVSMIIKKVNEGEIVQVHGTPDNIGSRYYLHARNHADAVLFLLNNVTPTHYVAGVDLIPDRFNVVGEVEMNNLQIAELIAMIMNKELYYEFVDFHSTRAGHDRRYALDGSKLTNLGWTPPYSLTSSMKSTIAWMLEHPQWLK
jgi:dTDP-glucose 4,6-dehydratase